VKPDNIFLDQDGVIKLGDYGAAVVFNADFKEFSPAYMSSDILIACKEVDHYCLAMSTLELCDAYIPTNNVFKNKAEIKAITNLMVKDLFVLLDNLLVCGRREFGAVVICIFRRILNHLVGCLNFKFLNKIEERRVNHSIDHKCLKRT
jgi:serine/threonine protein kinase